MKLTVTDIQLNRVKRLYEKKTEDYDNRDLQDFIDWTQEDLQSNKFYDAFYDASTLLYNKDINAFEETLLSMCGIDTFIKQCLAYKKGNIDDYTFEGIDLNNGAIILPEDTKKIGYSAFYAKSLRAIFIPKNVISISDHAFNLNNGIGIYFEETDPLFIAQMLTNSSYKDLLSYPNKFSCTKDEFVAKYKDIILE